MTKDNSVTLSEKYKRLGRFKGILLFLLFLLIIGGIIGIFLLVTQEDFDSNFDINMRILIFGVPCWLIQIYFITNFISIIDFLFDLDTK